MNNLKTSFQLPPKYQNDTPEEYLERLLSFYKQHHWLIHVLAFNFITLHEWNNFPLEWQTSLDAYLGNAGDNWPYAILDLTKENSDYVIISALKNNPF